MTTQLINRDNYFDVQAYLEHSARVRRNSVETVKRKRGLLRHGLEWAMDMPFSDATRTKVHFTDYLNTVGRDGQIRSDGKTGPLSAETKRKIAEEFSRFFLYMRKIKPQQYNSKSITDEWLASIRIKPKEDEVLEHEFYEIDEVKKLVAPPTHQETLAEFRLRAAIALLFVSGMRVGALVTMPIKAIDVQSSRPL